MVVRDCNLITPSAIGPALPFALTVLDGLTAGVAVKKGREGIQL